MNFDRTGIILYTLNYKDCVDFYENKIGLKKLFENEMLTCFEFGGTYLMVELDDTVPEGYTDEPAREKFCLRMNIENVKALADQLKTQGVEVDYQEHSWGTVAKFHDPDGNLCAFKDSASFEKQIEDFQKSVVK